MGDEPVDWRIIGDVKYEFEESPLPIRVDVLDWASTSPEFRKTIAGQPNITVQAAT